MQALGRTYVAHVNRRHGRSGTLWEGRFKSTIVDAEDYAMACYRYIEANPLRAGLVKIPDDYPWSSFRRNALGRSDALVKDHDCYLALAATVDERQRAYRQVFADGLTEELLATLRDATQRGWIPGRDMFRRQIEATLGRPLAPPVRGRPKRREKGPESFSS